MLVPATHHLCPSPRLAVGNCNLCPSPVACCRRREPRPPPVAVAPQRPRDGGPGHDDLGDDESDHGDLGDDRSGGGGLNDAGYGNSCVRDSRMRQRRRWGRSPVVLPRYGATTSSLVSNASFLAVMVSPPRDLWEERE